MKKLIAMISAIAVIGTMSLTSFAEITVTPNPELTTAVTLEKGESGGYDASYTSDDVNTQTTIVAVKGTEINTSSIQYINQLTQDSETVINFDLKDTLNAGETVTVYMGGDAIDKTKIGTIAQPFTVTFYNGDKKTALQTVEVEPTSDAGIAYTGEEAPTKAADNENTYTFADAWYYIDDEGNEVEVNLATLKVTSDLALYPKFTATPKEVGGGEDTIKVTFVNGTDSEAIVVTAVNGAVTAPAAVTKADATSAVTDSGVVSFTFYKWTTAEGTTDYDAGANIPVTESITLYAKYDTGLLLGDIDGNSEIGSRDYGQIKNKYNDKKVNYAVGEPIFEGSDIILGDIDENTEIGSRDYGQVKNKYNDKKVNYAVGEAIYIINK